MRAVEITGDWSPRAGSRLSEDEKAGHWARNATDVWRNPRWKVVERPAPQLLRPDDVLIRSRAVGICGSDIHLYETDADGYVLLPYRVRLPLVPGHEIAGEVVEVGPAVHSVRPGDPVAVQTLQYCGYCDACQAGLPGHCSEAEDRGFNLDGGMAQLMISRERNVRSLAAVRERHSERETFEIGALCEPASVAYVGMFLRAGGILPGAAVAVHGCGPIGLAAVALARAAGAATVLAFDGSATRCKLAEQLGADAAYDVLALRSEGVQVADVVLEATRGEGADMSVEAAGAAGSILPQIEGSLAVGGKVLFLGSEAGAVAMQTMSYMLRGASVYGSIGNIGGLDPVIALQASARIDLRPMVTARYGLEQAMEAVERASQRQDAKVLVLPND